MSPFETLYGWSCNTTIYWSDPMNTVLIGPDMLAEMEQEMEVIKKNLKKAREYMHKIYVDQNSLFKEFQVGEQVYLALSQRRAP